MDETGIDAVPATLQPTVAPSKIGTGVIDNGSLGDGELQEQEEEEQCYGICPVNSNLLNPTDQVNMTEDSTFSCSAIDSVFRDQTGDIDACNTLAFRARRAGCQCGQAQFEPDLGTSSDLTEAGYTAILAASAALLLFVFVGVRICLYKYSANDEAAENKGEKSIGDEITVNDLPESPPTSRPRKGGSPKSVRDSSGLSGISKTVKDSTKDDNKSKRTMATSKSVSDDSGLSSISSVNHPNNTMKPISKSKQHRKPYMQSWMVWTQQQDGQTVDMTLDDTTTDGEKSDGEKSSFNNSSNHS